jgi:replicative DNA helicase
MSIKNAIKAFRTELVDRQSNPSPVWGLPTGFRGYDLKTGGLHAKEVTVWAGRTGMGKTAAAVQAIGHVCDHLVHLRDPRVVQFFSAEMSAEELVRRLAAQRLQLSVVDMMKGTLPPEDEQRLDSFLKGIENWPLEIDDTVSPDLDFIAERAKQLVGKWRPEDGPSPLALLVVDHIGKLKVMDNRGRVMESEYASQTEVADRLYRAARALHCPVIEVAQINRSVEDQGGGAFSHENIRSTRPRLSQLRSSGRIEDNAHVVTIFWRESYYQSQIDGTEDEGGDMEFNLAKGRNCGTGVYHYEFDPMHTSISEKYRPPRFELPDDAM